jgi:hypothetical protein
VLEELLPLASLPLPEEARLFQEALRSADNLDESDLGRWDVDPPLDLNSGIESISESRYTARLTEVMHGRRLRQQQERDKERLTQWDAERRTTQERIDEVARELAQAVDRWAALRARVSGFQRGSREGTMAYHLLQWHARAAVHLDNVLSILSDCIQAL